MSDQGSVREDDLSAERTIAEGGVYRYTKDWPPGCLGMRYRVLSIKVMDVPVYQERVLVECLEGPDKGRLFVCSPWNFWTRYEKA